MTVRDPAVARYNRRTRAIERQATALEGLAAAAKVLALASVTTATAKTSAGLGLSWTRSAASELMTRLLREGRDL